MMCDPIKLYHGSSEPVEHPEIRISKFHKDFYFGFYCTNKFHQAKRWAVRHTGRGVVSVYQYEPRDDFRELRFETMTEEWLDFIARCRSGQSHDYDIVEGPMADDTIFNYVQSFMEKQISRAAFWELAKFKHPTHQISFHSARALATLEFVESMEVSL